MRKRTIIEADYSEIENLVRPLFSKYGFVPVQECGNDTSHQFNGINGELDKFEQDDINKWYAGEFVGYSNDAILNHLCHLGIIEPGDYIIKVCW